MAPSNDTEKRHPPMALQQRHRAWHPAMTPNMNSAKIGSWHPAMTKQWHPSSHDTPQWHLSNGAQLRHQQRHPAMAPKQWRPSNGTQQWHSSMAPSMAPSNGTQLRLEVRTPIARAIGGIVSHSASLGTQLKVHKVQSLTKDSTRNADTVDTSFDINTCG